MNRKINNRQKRDELIDGYFNKNWCCDLDEVKNAVFDTIQELEEANDINATRIIELTQRIDKAIDYIKHSQSYGTMAQVMPHLKPYVNGDDLLEILGDKE